MASRFPGHRSMTGARWSAPLLRSRNREQEAIWLGDVEWHADRRPLELRWRSCRSSARVLSWQAPLRQQSVGPSVATRQLRSSTIIDGASPSSWDSSRSAAASARYRKEDAAIAAPPCAVPNVIAGNAQRALKALTEVRMAATSSFCFLSLPVQSVSESRSGS